MVLGVGLAPIKILVSADPMLPPTVGPREVDMRRGSVADALDGADLSAITAQFGGGLKLR